MYHSTNPNIPLNDYKKSQQSDFISQSLSSQTLSSCVISPLNLFFFYSGNCHYL